MSLNRHNRLDGHQSWIVNVLMAWGATAVGLAVAAWAFHSFWISSWSTLLIAAAVYAFVNAFVKPFVTFLALPLIIVTLGVAYFFVTMLMLWLTVKIVDGFEIRGFWTYVGATIVVALVNGLVRRTTSSSRKTRVFGHVISR